MESRQAKPVKGTVMEPKGGTCAQRTLKILIVDDDPICRRLMQGLLSPYGSSDTAADGEEGLLACRLAWEKKAPYDLICLDILMPRMNGHEMLRKIRQSEKELGIADEEGVRIIMTTAVDDTEDVLLAFTLGCEAYVFKPIDRHKLIGEIRNLGLIGPDEP